MQVFRESYLGNPDLRVDRDAGVIRGVKLLGRESRNGREYTLAIREAAGFYEGVDVFVDHGKDPSAVRSVAEGIAVVQNVSTRDDGNWGDLHLLKSHPLYEQIMERAERWPRTIGMSHVATGVGRKQHGKLVVESIKGVQSLDLVTRPATTNGLYEHAQEAPTVTKKLSAFVEELDASPAQRLLAAACPRLGDLELSLAEGDDQREANVKFAVQAVLAEATEAGDDVLAELLQEAAKPAPAPPETLEQRLERLAATVETLALREQARAALEAQQVAPRAELIDELVALREADAMAERIRDWPAARKHPAQRPAVAPLRAPQRTSAALPTDVKQFVAALRG